jgi:hypothetical protein
MTSSLGPINNEAIQMVLRGPNAQKRTNLEDSYQTVRPVGSLNADGEVDIPQDCNVKEALIYKLEDIDEKINHLLNSNAFFEKEISENPDDEEYAVEMREYIKENQDVILDKKNQLLKIINAFMKAGTDLSKEVYPRMKYKGLYLPEFENDHICDHDHHVDLNHTHNDEGDEL